VNRVFGPERLAESLADCDILVISAPYLAGTNQVISSSQIAKLKRGAILVNVARGQIVDESAMLESLRSGQLGGAVLDVFHQEPLESSSPLWSLPNVIISPHSSGFRTSHWDEVIDLFSENIRRFQRGEPLLNPVDCGAGY
jgi:phosphoglycerate dehydrogenase-like enzyme